MKVMVQTKQFHFSIAEVPITFVDRGYNNLSLEETKFVDYLKGLAVFFIQIE